MSDYVGKRRGNPNWAPGGSGAGRNLQGAKPKSESFAEKVRLAITDEELIGFAVDAIRNPETPWRERCQLHNYLTTRAHGSVPNTLDLNIGQQPEQWIAPANWALMSQAQRCDYLGDLRQRALAGVVDDDIMDAEYEDQDDGEENED